MAGSVLLAAVAVTVFTCWRQSENVDWATPRIEHIHPIGYVVYSASITTQGSATS